MPPPSKKGQFAAQAEQTLGIRPGTKLWSPYPFAGLNLQDTPSAIDDKEFSYIKNFFHLGNGYLRTAWDAGTAFYTAPSGKTILPYFFWYSIGSTDYLAVFFNDGTAVQVNKSTGATTSITTALGTFYQNGWTLPACVQWGSQYLVISHNNGFNGYFIWDGTLLYQAGTVGPIVTLSSSGANYSSTPTVTAYGGVGSGVTVTPTIINGAVSANVVTDQGSGYVPGDMVQLQYSGGGSDTGAILQAFVGSGTVASASVTAGGSGYTGTPTVTFSAPTGTTATGTAEYDAAHGVISGVVITNPGGGYTSAPTVTFTGGGGGSQAAGVAIIQNGFVVAVQMTNVGHEYTATPTVTFSAPPAAVTATGTAITSSGAVTGITITNPGSGYTSPPTVTISGGSGTGATAVAYLAAGNVVAIGVVNGGTNYTYPPPLSFIGGGGGTGAAAIAVLTGTTIASINVTSGGGPGYTSAPTVTFNNAGTGGTGGAATAIIENGQVVAISLTDAGSGYTLPPYITFSGGGLPTGGVEATATAILTGTSIASVIVSNQGQGYTQAPGVVVAAGANNAASAVMNMMPFGISGSSIETFNSAVWLAYPFQRTTIPTSGDLIKSAAGSLTDFATSDGGVLFQNSDRFLRKQFVNLRQSNGYLYAFGDSSVSVISNVQTTGNPPTTTFTYQNTDPQIGLAWRDTIADFGRTIIFANETGVYGLFGGAATKISSKLDQLFVNAIYPPDARAVVPTACVATIFNIKHYCLFLTIVDPQSGAVVNAMAAWNEKDWTLITQSPALTFVGTDVVDSLLTAWGTDGTSIYPLFTTPSSTLQKAISTKNYGSDSLFILKDFLGLYIQGQDLSVGTVGIDIAINAVASGIAIQPSGLSNIDNERVASAEYNSANYEAVLFQEPDFPAPPPYWPVWGSGSGGFSFDTLTMQFTTASPDFVLSNIVLTYEDATAYQ